MVPTSGATFVGISGPPAAPALVLLTGRPELRSGAREIDALSRETAGRPSRKAWQEQLRQAGPEWLMGSYKVRGWSGPRGEYFAVCRSRLLPDSGSGRAYKCTW